MNSSPDISVIACVYRVQLEVDEVLGTKTFVSAEDLDKLEYTEQVYGSYIN